MNALKQTTHTTAPICWTAGCIAVVDGNAPIIPPLTVMKFNVTIHFGAMWIIFDGPIIKTIDTRARGTFARIHFLTSHILHAIDVARCL